MENGDVLNNQQGHSPETQKVVRLVDYLLRLATLRTKLIRDVEEYDKVLWVSDVPHERGCFTQAWGRDEEHDPDEWLEVQSRRVSMITLMEPPMIALMEPFQTGQKAVFGPASNLFKLVFFTPFQSVVFR